LYRKLLKSVNWFSSYVENVEDVFLRHSVVAMVVEALRFLTAARPPAADSPFLYGSLLRSAHTTRLASHCVWSGISSYCVIAHAHQQCDIYMILAEMLTTPAGTRPDTLYTVSPKNSQDCFQNNFVKFPPTLITFSTKMAETILLSTVHSFTTSPNLCQRTTV